VVVNSPMPTGTVTSYFISRERERKVKKQSGEIFRLFLFLLLCSQTSFFSAITCENNTTSPRERARERTNDVGSDDASAEKADRGERCVEFDCEERRYFFPTYSSEIERDRS